MKKVNVVCSVAPFFHNQEFPNIALKISQMFLFSRVATHKFHKYEKNIKRQSPEHHVTCLP